MHNRSELIDTQAYFKRKAASVLHLRSMHFALVPGGVSEDQYTDEPLKTVPIQNPIQYTSWRASYDKNAVYYVSEAPPRAVIKR